MLKRLITVSLFFATSGPLIAQTALPLPNEIFTEAVEVVEVHPVVDNTGRTLSIFQDGDWLHLPYPDRLSQIAVPAREYASSISDPQIARRPDGTLIMLEPSSDAFAAQAWVVIPGIESLYPTELPCNTSDFKAGNPWSYTTIGMHTFLCNWMTGEISPLLPEPLWWGDTYFGGIDQPDLSPDGRFLVIRGPFGRDNMYGDRFYSYELETQTFRFIGEVTGNYKIIELSGWLTPSLFVVNASDMPEWSGRRQYVGNVVSVNSLEFAISLLRFYPRPVLDPPGLEAMDAALLDGPTPGPCFVWFYDAISRRLNWYDTGALCEYGIPIPDGSGDRLYRAIYPSAVVVRYNFFNGTRRNLFIGEVETLGPVAPDGTLGLVALDNSGVVDTDQDPDANFGIELVPTEYVVMALNDGHILGRVPAEAQWLTASYLYDQGRLYTVAVDEIRSSVLPGEIIMAQPDQSQLLLRTAGSELALFSPANGALEPVARIPAGYSVSAREHDDDIIELTLYSDDEALPQMTFDVRLP